MGLIDKLFDAIMKRKKGARRLAAWLLVFSVFASNVGMTSFASEMASGFGSGNVGTPSNADRGTASPVIGSGSNASREEDLASPSDALIPEEAIDNETLLKEASFAVTYGMKFDFKSFAKISDNQDTEVYEKLFEDSKTFLLFSQNGEDGRLAGEDGKSYGYILIRLDEKQYEEYIESRTKQFKLASDSDAEDLWEEGAYQLTGDEDFIFLYVNATKADVTFRMNLADIAMPDVEVPSVKTLKEGEEPETRKPETAEAIPSGGAAGTGTNESQAETSIAPEETLPAGGEISSEESGSGSEDKVKDPTEAAKESNGETSEKETLPSEGMESNEGKEPEETAGQVTESSSAADTKPAEMESVQPTEKETAQQTEGETRAEGKEEPKAEAKEETQAEAKAEAQTEQEKSDSHGADSPDTEISIQSDGESSEGNVSDSSVKIEGKTADDSTGIVSYSRKVVPVLMEAAGQESEEGAEDEAEAAETSEAEKASEPSKTEETPESKETVVTVLDSEDSADTEYSKAQVETSDVAFTDLNASDHEDEEEEPGFGMTGTYQVAYSGPNGEAYLNVTALPVVMAKVTQPSAKSSLFRSALNVITGGTTASFAANVLSADGLVPKISGAHKQIEYLGGEDYRLHLDIAGGGTPLDVLLVIDTSGSMNDKLPSGKSRLSRVKDILLGYKNGKEQVTGFVDNILGKNEESRFGIVTFAEKGNAVLSWTNDKSQISSAVNKLSAGGGTNCEDGLWEATTMLKTVESGHIPYMIFLSDGKPTYFMSKTYDRYKGWATDTFEGTSNNGTIVGDGSSDRSSETINAVNCKDGFRELNKDLTAFAVNVGGKANSNVLNTITGNAKKVFTAEDDTALTNAFEAIFDSLKLKNVVITDTLSQWVEIKDPTLSEAVVKVTTDSGEKILESSKYRLSYDTTTRTVKLDLSKATSDGILDRNAKYSVSFEIKVSESAKRYYRENGVYPDTGAEDTDYEGNSTSSGQAGFFSNDSAKAVWAGNTEGYTYPKPVVQTPYEPGHEKYIKDNGDGTYDLTLNVKSTVESSSSTTTEKIPADIVFVIDKSGSMRYPMNGDSYASKWENTRAYVINTALDAMFDELGNGDYDLQFRGIKFSTAGNTKDCGSWTGSGTTAYDNMHILKNYSDYWWNWEDSEQDKEPNGGTEPATALRMAIDLLREGSAANKGKKNLKKYLIFFTDGVPEGEPMEASYEALNSIGMDNLTVHAIRVSASADVAYLNNIVNTVRAQGINTHKPWEGNDTNELLGAFNSIKNEIISSISTNTYGVTGITITDELSEYADFVNLDPSNAVIAVNGKAMTKEEYEKAVSSVTITERTADTSPKIVVQFKPDYELIKDAVYSVTFSVRPTEKAYQEYAVNTVINPDDPYGGITGDEGTDAPGNHTSSGKPGFHTNSKATLEYTWGTTHGTLDYQHPVLQVSLGKVKIKKVVDGTAPDPDDQFIIHLNQGNDNYTSVVLKDKETSPYIHVSKTETFQVDESVPMEYWKADTFLVVKDARSGDEISGRLNGAEVTVMPGDDLLIEVHNQFGHKPYFHAAAAVTNYTSGNAEVPFNQDGPVDTSLPETPVAAAVDPGERRVTIKVLEEDERLA